MIAWQHLSKLVPHHFYTHFENKLNHKIIFKVITLEIFWPNRQFILDAIWIKKNIHI